MKRMYYVSRFARPLSKRDLEDIHESALRNNRRMKITGFLVCLDDTFFQALEGPETAVERLYFERILPDARHKNVHCLKTERSIRRRMFPDWNMKVFNLNEETEGLPIAFREMLTALLESNHMIARYTQPSILDLLEQGVTPTSVQPRRRRVTVLFSDIIGFSYFAEHLKPAELIGIVNSHFEVCTQFVSQSGGQLNKLTGDGVLAYFTGKTSDAALESATEMLNEMRRRRSLASKDSPHRLLYGGVGLANGLVSEGNIGAGQKLDFTILGNTVNLASRLESLTRTLNVRLTFSPSVVRQAAKTWPFVSLGRHKLKGQSRAVEVFALQSLSPLMVDELYERIRQYVRRHRR